MPAGQVFSRVVPIGLALGAIDALAGRVLQAHPDPSWILSLGATGWVTYRLARAGHRRLSLYAGLTVWLAFMVSFVLVARVLVGWNNSVAWEPRSGAWLVAFAAAAPVVAVLAQTAGFRARSSSRDATESGATTA